MMRWNVGRLEGCMALMAVLSIIPTVQLSSQEPFPTRPPAPTPLRPAQYPPFQEAAHAPAPTGDPNGARSSSSRSSSSCS